METVKITLNKPIMVDGQERSELTMREPMVSDQILAQSSDSPAQNEVQLFANLCDIPVESLTSMHLANYQRLQQAFADFLA